MSVKIINKKMLRGFFIKNKCIKRILKVKGVTIMNQHKISLMSLCIGVLFIIVSGLILWHPTSGRIGILIIIAITSIIEGLVEVFAKHKIHQFFGVEGSKGLTTFFGILLIIIGVILLFNLNFGLAIFPYVFAVWFVIDSVENIFLLPFARMVSKAYYWFCILAATLGIIVGVMLFFNPSISNQIFSIFMSLFFAWFGVQYIWEAFAPKYF